MKLKECVCVYMHVYLLVYTCAHAYVIVCRSVCMHTCSYMCVYIEGNTLHREDIHSSSYRPAIFYEFSP